MFVESSPIAVLCRADSSRVFYCKIALKRGFNRHLESLMKAIINYSVGSKLPLEFR